MVSIVVPAYHAVKYIGTMIDSCRAQTFTDWELCIVADGDEQTYEAATDAAGGLDKIGVHLIEHSGYPAAFNAALAMASGDVICRIDADDSQEPTRIERQLECLLAHPDCDVCSCEMSILKGDRMRPVGVGGLLPDEFIEGHMSHGPVGPSLMATRRAYEVAGGFEAEHDPAPDAGWIIKAMRAGLAFCHVPEHLYIYRKHDDQMTSVAGVCHAKYLELIEEHRRILREKHNVHHA